jgi:Proto-chlorophyllide reductase 57 kD subunit
MLVCGCGRWMHTQGVSEQQDNEKELWLVRLECRGCRQLIGLEAIPSEAVPMVDRLLWSDEADQRFDRMPPYVQVLLKPQVEDYARSTGQRVVTVATLEQVRCGGSVRWAADAEERLENVPPAVRSMARIELERTAMERGEAEVTVTLMEEVKARYFGMGRTAR